jgi:hypothetical protein
MHEDGRPQIYVRAEDSGQRTLTYVVLTDRAPASLVPDVHAAVRHIDPRPLTLAGVALGLVAVTMLACYVPARRILGIDPAQSLRQE